MTEVNNQSGSELDTTKGFLVPQLVLLFFSFQESLLFLLDVFIQLRAGLLKLSQLLFEVPQSRTPFGTFGVFAVDQPLTDGKTNMGCSLTE